MVFSRSEVKRRTKESDDPLGENPKRSKVHAQRKFAQGSGMNSPIMTPIKEKEKTKANGTPSPAELLPSKRPATEDFLSYLCFRGTKALPPRLDFFNEASTSGRTDNVTANSSKQSNNSPSGAQKIKPRNSGTQVYKKTLSERQTGLQKGNAMRARTASDDRQTNRKHRIERQLRRKAGQRRAKTIRKTHPSILKRLGANRLRAGLRSGGQLPPGSEVGLKTDRKPKRGRPKRQRIKKKMDEIPKKRLKQDEELNEDDLNEEEDSEDEEEDEEEEEEDAGEEEKKAQKKTNMTMRTRGASNSPALSLKKQSVSSRPSRKTKEAATLYMEMITKDLRNPEDESDDEYVRSFPDLPSAVKKEKEDVRSSSTKTGKQEKQLNKGSKLKVGKTLKSVKQKDEEEEDEPLLKRSQRLQVKGIPIKGKPNLKIKGPYKVKSAKTLSNDKSSKKGLAKKKLPGKKELNTTIESAVDEDENDENDEAKDDFLNSPEEKKSSETSASGGRIRRKRNEDINDSTKSNLGKKRKSIPEPTSENSEESEEEVVNTTQRNSSKKMKRNTDNTAIEAKVSKTGAVIRKPKKSSTENESIVPASRRESYRNLKKQLNGSEDDDVEFSPKGNTLKRSKRVKNDSDDEAYPVKGKTRPRSAKYKEESEEEEDEEETVSPKKLRGSLQRRAKNRLSEGIIEKNVRKSVRNRQVKAKNKPESDVESEEYSENDEIEIKMEAEEEEVTHKKLKGPKKIKGKSEENEERKLKGKDEIAEETENSRCKIQETSLDKVKCEELSDEGEKSCKKIKNTQQKKVKQIEESDEELDVKQRKPRGFQQKGTKNKKESDDEDTSSCRKLRGSNQRKSKNKYDTDEEDVIILKKVRGSLQRKTKVKNDSDEELDDSIANKIRTNIQRRNKSKQSGAEKETVKNNELSSSDEDEDFIKDTNMKEGKEAITKKTKNKDEDEDYIEDTDTRQTKELRAKKAKNKDEDEDNITNTKSKHGKEFTAKKTKSEIEEEDSNAKSKEISTKKGKNNDEEFYINDTNIKQEKEISTKKAIIKEEEDYLKDKDAKSKEICTKKAKTKDEDQDLIKNTNAKQSTELNTKKASNKDEDEEYKEEKIIKRGKEVTAKKAKSKEEFCEGNSDNQTKKKTNFRNLKGKFDRAEDNEDQIKKEIIKVQDINNLTIKEEILNKEDSLEIDSFNNKLAAFVDVVLKKEKEDENMEVKELGKGLFQQKELQRCSDVAEEAAEKLEYDSSNEAMSKQISDLGQRKRMSMNDENLVSDKIEKQFLVQTAISNLNEDRCNKSSKDIGKKKAKKSTDTNEGGNAEVKKEATQLKLFKRNEERKLSTDDSKTEGFGKKKDLNETNVTMNKDNSELVWPQQNSRSHKENEGGKVQKVRVMPRRSSRKGYEESDDEIEHFNVRRKHSLRTNLKSVCYDDNSDDDDENDVSSNSTDEDSIERELPQKRNQKANTRKILKKDEEFSHQIENKIDIKEVKSVMVQEEKGPKNDILLNEDISNKIINDSNISDSSFKKGNSAFSSVKKKSVEDKEITEEEDSVNTTHNVKEKNSKSKDTIKIEQPSQKVDQIERNAQNINIGVPDTKNRLNFEKDQKNVHDALSRTLLKEKDVKEREINVGKISDERRKGRGKGMLGSPEMKDVSPSKEESAYQSKNFVKPFLDNDEKKGGFGKLINAAPKKQTKFNSDDSNENLQVPQKYPSGIGYEKAILKKGMDVEIRKPKKSLNELGQSNAQKKPKEVGVRYSRKIEDVKRDDKMKEFSQKKSEDKLKKTPRCSFGDNEEKIDNYEKFVDDSTNIHLEQSSNESMPPRVSLRKPALNARALIRKDDDDDDDDDEAIDSKTGNIPKTPALIKQKSVGERDSCDTVGSGSSGIVDCKVVIERNISRDVLKIPKRAKPQDENVSGKFVGGIIGLEDSPIKKNTSVTSINVDTAETSKIEDKREDNEKQKPKQSINETWRQAFKNAKIPKPGHLSPVPHTVKPFVRQKLPSSSLTGFPGKSQDNPELNAKPKVSPTLSPFKSLIAQNQRSSSPDAKRHLSPAHKVNFGFESPVRKTDDIKTDLRKQEAPVKSFTQLQYEKRSSEFISSLDSGPSVLPGFESIRAYKNDIKREEPKELKPETPPITEPVVKPSPEGKHLNLPLAVEHTLRRASPITKKPPVKLLQVKTDNLSINKAVIPPVVVEKTVDVEPSLPLPSSSVNPGPTCQPAPANIDLIVRDQSDLSFMAKKKVNMTAEEINRWLNDSTSSGIEHKKDCGIFENNQCECSFRTSGASMQNSVGMSELVPKDDGKIDHGVVGPPVQLKELDKDGKYTAETISTCKVEEYKEKLLSKSENKMAPPKPRRSSGQERFKSNKSMTEEEMCEYDFRFERTSNSPRESVSDVSSVTHRDDVSSSSEVPERKIFHQKRSASNKRPSISSPTAFSAENESSVYAFKPDPPSITNRPFRRGRGKSGDLDDGKQPSSSSIAVQVNLETESVLESSTQTERSNDDNEGHVFYIPLPDEQLQSGVPQGVAVKLDTEGPDQRVIMRAKIVTKPGSSLPPPSNSRALVTSGRGNHQKPEQKVRPLYSGRTVGAVPPTMREPQTNDQGTTTAPEKPRQSPQVAQSSQSTQINQASPKGPESPRSRSLTKAQKAAEVATPSPPPTAIEWKGTEFPPPDIPATLVEAPTFYPDEKDFQDPLEYIEQLTPLAQSFGICRIVPPSSFKPECKVSDEMRFTAYNQYVHKLMERWGPNVRELCAIKKYLATQSISLIQLPMIGSMEVDLPRLYQTVQQCGGLKEVIEKKRWARVADVMRIPKSAQDRVTKLDDIYCKFLLPYDTLSHDERTKLLEEVDDEWREREKRLAADDESGNNGSGDGSEESSDTDDNVFECITKGKSMPLSVFFRIARNTMATWFKDTTPSASEVEAEFWRHVSTKTCHVCVHCGSIDSGTWGYGFPTTKSSSTSRHPWNLKVLTNSSGSILRSLGPLMGVTVPTLHVGMLFSCCCWYRDPHALPWIEYLHTGASKIWYGVPDSRASELRKAMYPLLPRHIRDRKIWLPSDTMMVPPQFLLDGGVSLCRVVQEPGQFILVFPKAFTSSICTGYLVSESVYFAQPSWLNTAVQVFKDIQDSSEPPVFSLDKLLFNIANDTRSSADVLTQVLEMLKSVIEKEVESRKKLENLGLTSWERLPSHKSGRRKKKEEEQGDLECETCRGALFLSVVVNSNEDCSYCIDHAVEALSKDQSLLKYCKPMFAYDEEEMEELMDKVKARIEAKTLKKQKEKGSSSGNRN